MTKDVRTEVRAAMDRLLARNPLRSDGKLTIKSLAVEADVPRHILTQVHTDLKDEFYGRVRNETRSDPATEAALAELAEAQQEGSYWKERAQRSEAEFDELVRAMQVRALTKDPSSGEPRLTVVREGVD